VFSSFDGAARLELGNEIEANVPKLELGNETDAGAWEQGGRRVAA
jgi:hypothetical protein